MPGEDECEHEMNVLIRRGDAEALAVPLAQLSYPGEDAGGRQAVEDWQYWVDRGYEL